MKAIKFLILLTILFLQITCLYANNLDKPIVNDQLVFDEQNGIVIVEAEHFYKQSKTERRSWYIASSNDYPKYLPDADVPHISNSSNNAYIEILPDTRRTHDDKLIKGLNFSNEPGKLAILHYKVNFNSAGRYYVWVRAHSTGSEDNGVHVGINGTWPETGQRMQWCEGKNTWKWESKQRTQENHCGEPYLIYLDIPKPGEHDIQFSMREDGFEMDKWIMTNDRNFMPDEKSEQKVTLLKGKLPAPFPKVTKIIKEKDSKTIYSTQPQLNFSDPTKRNNDGDGSVVLSGELKEWHKVTLTLDGPFAHELDLSPNPFRDYRMTVKFEHESGKYKYSVPGYFTADGNASETTADCGTKWRAHFSPDLCGKWNYEILFIRGNSAAVFDINSPKDIFPYHGKKGSFEINKTDKTDEDFRSKGRLEYVNKHHLQFAGSKEYFLKAGADSPETFLAYYQFDATYTMKNPLKTWDPHFMDWNDGDPAWQDFKGKGIIGAINYLAGKGVNAISFLTYNAAGDGDNIWPFVKRDAKLNYDCSKLDQWQILFDHAQSKGIHLNFKTQETENDNLQRGRKKKSGFIGEALDEGDVGVERRIYYRELIARFGYLLALDWNLGEENSQTTKQQQEMAAYISNTDPFNHNIVIHTYPDQQDEIYNKLLGDQSLLTGVSLQNSWKDVHKKTLQWLKASAKSGKPWIVANDEQNSASKGVPPDSGIKKFNPDSLSYDLNDIRKQTLWGNLMAGGAGVEYYFGYKLPENDILCEDYRSRDKSWDYCKIALDFFNENNIPFWEMSNKNSLINNDSNEKEKYCFAKEKELYLVYLGYTETSSIDLSNADGNYSISWFNPREGGKLVEGSITNVKGGNRIDLGYPPADKSKDWLVIVTKK